ncbi:Glu-tRNA(Gln) amidotransferase subunit GatE [Candidatus Pacearchaeota archaeon]|nr:Glu-tRNA(Gln) amidotransferase subunit GatE [Candidatus Pacearchaeota archaeon]
MSEHDLNYTELGFKAGLEIHQQLDTHKLFCNCLSELVNSEPEFEIKRKLHAIAGETGDIDIAVRFEAGKDREFTYQGYSQNTCLVELDESPPEMINLEALKITLQVALLLNCEVFPVTQIMRKTVIDGSNTSGFQRTVLIARNGFVETKHGRVGIDTVALEEDAARIVENDKDKNKVVYRLDRLGIPLIEIATAPDIKNPEQIKGVALHIGDILRACRVKRGIGTIRQDINISVKGHPRIEIKGFQEPRMMVVTAEKEIQRQLANIKNKKLDKEVRKANPDGTTSFLRPMPGAARMYPETDLPLLNISRDLINGIKANLPKLRSDIKEELKGHGLNDEMINLIVSENKLDELKELIQINSDSNLIAKMLVLWPKEISIKEKISLDEINKKLTLDVLETILQALNNKKIQKHDIQNILLDIVKSKSVSEAIKLEKQSNEELEKLENEIKRVIKEKPGLNINAYMGLIMAKFKGKVSGKEVIEMLGRYVKG